MLELLILKGAHLNAINISYQNKMKILKIKIISKKWRWLNHNKETTLHIAAEYNSKKIGEILIIKGANINAKDISYQKIKTFF